MVLFDRRLRLAGPLFHHAARVGPTGPELAAVPACSRPASAAAGYT
jgi:hypothetical protein